MYQHLSSDFKNDSILLLNKSVINKSAKPIDDFKLNELIYGDRFLRYQQDWAFDYLTSIQSPVYEFIKKNDIRFVFGEITHSYEILISRIAKRKKGLNCDYLHPQSVRIPHKRFFFLDDEFQYGIYKDNAIQNNNWEKEWKPIKAQKPRRVKQVDKEVEKEISIGGKLSRVKRLFTKENIEYDHPSVIAKDWIRSKHAVKEELNKLNYKRVKPSDISDIEGKKFVLYTLHMQPEASVDVVGAYYNDQFEIINRIWRMLPPDWYLVIKEHSNAIGNRTLDFFKEFSKLRNTIILDEKINSHLLIEKAQCIFSISGTVAYEAALKKVPAFTFGDIFFNRLQHCHKVTYEDFRKSDNLAQLIKKKEKANAHKMTIEEFSKFIYKVSYRGIVDAPIDSEDWLDPAVIKETMISFNTFIDHFY